MKKFSAVLFSFILLLSFLLLPTNNAYAEKVTYKWGKITYKANHIGKIIVKKETKLYYWDKEYDELIEIGTLSKGKEYPIYSTRDSGRYGELLSIGDNKLVKNNSSVTYQKPSKHMKETVGKERVWLRNPAADDLTNLQEAIIISKKKYGSTDYYDYVLKAKSKYYTLSAKKGTEKWYYMKTNPFKKYKYSKSTWDLIKKEKIKLGMTTNQVFLSWGYADDINSYSNSYSGSTEQWIYGDVLDGATYLYFRNNKLESWQDF
ncbi:hypothetical protein [Peribacillus asahii]|uniref:hypothetical protein n=1 Tax=Peribacillus asahii TaxID=228899 RepID=UPI002079B78F|nr:hypothetical protein [Peribacillus asahii]USK69185.1 hypothetical protein LIS76_16675 [Peribacillus asahii]